MENPSCQASMVTSHPQLIRELAELDTSLPFEEITCFKCEVPVRLTIDGHDLFGTEQSGWRSVVSAFSIVGQLFEVVSGAQDGSEGVWVNPDDPGEIRVYPQPGGVLRIESTMTGASVTAPAEDVLRCLQQLREEWKSIVTARNPGLRRHIGWSTWFE